MHWEGFTEIILLLVLNSLYMLPSAKGVSLHSTVGYRIGKVILLRYQVEENKICLVD